MTPLSDYWQMLNNFDWHYEDSDDHSVWRRGNARQKDLEQIAKESDKHQKLYYDFQYHAFSGPAYKTPQQPKPAMPLSGNTIEISMGDPDVDANDQ